MPPPERAKRKRSRLFLWNRTAFGTKSCTLNENIFVTTSNADRDHTVTHWSIVTAAILPREPETTSLCSTSKESTWRESLSLDGIRWMLTKDCIIQIRQVKAAEKNRESSLPCLFRCTSRTGYPPEKFPTPIHDYWSSQSTTKPMPCIQISDSEGCRLDEGNSLGQDSRSGTINPRRACHRTLSKGLTSLAPKSR